MILEPATTAKQHAKIWLTLGLLLSLVLAAPSSLFAVKKKKSADVPKTPVIDYSNIVWPNPPAIARIRYQAFYAAQKLSQVEGTSTKKQKWMDRLAGTQSATDSNKSLFQLVEPYGMAVDSNNNLYVADQKVGAIFIFNTDTREADLIKNSVHAHFVRIIGLAMDDNDRLFVSDPGLRHVSDVELDQVLVYDADSLRLLRKIGATGQKHELTTPGNFAKPTGLAIDADGNLYVCDTLNNRIEVFDADGKFVSTYGKNGDGPGYFGRPKGIAIDSDGHIWVADGMQDRVQVFNREWQLLISFGGHGLLPGQFQGLVGIAIDKNNRVFTSEIFPGRVQGFGYVTDAQAEQLRKERDEQREKKAAAMDSSTASTGTTKSESK